MHDVPAVPGRTLVGPNVISGYDGNSVTPGVVGATIFGGWELNENGAITTVANVVMADFGTIGGGSNNRIKTRMVAAQTVVLGSTVAGGSVNATSENYAFIGGGVANDAEGGVAAECPCPEVPH